MAYTQQQARNLAKQIYDRFGERIESACAGSGVPPKFVAGLIGNEAGKDSKGQIKENATRFEPHVFAALKAVRDGRKTQYNYITKKDIGDATDAALKALAKSYGLTQIMGWHVIKNLKCTLADLKNPEKHLSYTVKLLKINSTADFAAKDYEPVLRMWNTGKRNGTTYHASYVPNAFKVMEAYEEIRKSNLAGNLKKIAAKVKTDFADAKEETDFFSTSNELPGGNKAAGAVIPETEKQVDSEAAAPPQTETLTKERPSSFTRLWTAIVAGVGSLTGLGINAQSLFDKGIEGLTAKHLILLGFAFGLVALALVFYDRSRKNANELNKLKAELAAAKDKNTVEFVLPQDRQ